MSAEFTKRMTKASGLVVAPQVVSDKTVMESVVDFISDVVPQAYSGAVKCDDKKDRVLWVRFEKADINDWCFYQNGIQVNGNVPPILLVLGYTNGVQIWMIPANGEAQEVLSLRQGAVKIIKVLPNPQPDQATYKKDEFCDKRPIAALCDSSSTAQKFCAVSFVSLKTGDQIHCIKFKNSVCDLHCNKDVIVVSFMEKIAVFDSCTFKDRFSVTTCYPSPGPCGNPIALGSRWLAYADRKLVSVHQTCGGMAVNGIQSYTATVIHAAKTITKGLTMFGETVASSITGTQKPHHQGATTSASSMTMSSTSGPTKVKPTGGVADHLQPGIVSIVDTMTVPSGELQIHDDWNGDGLVAHFPAHDQQPIVSMKFDSSGMLLLTACKQGHYFHLFRILPHPGGSMLSAVHHLYTLHRGDTTAKVQDISFALDSRWVAVSTVRGTTHIFPITPYGGPVGVRTHTSTKVVNRLSRFHKSAGLDDMQTNVSNPAGGRNSPILSNSPGSGSSIKGYEAHPSMLPYHSTMTTGRMGNPRLPPYPHPTVVSPLAQIKQPSILFPGMSNPSSPSLTSRGRSSSSVNTSCGNSFVTVASIFASSRGWVISSPSISREKSEAKPVDSLYVVGCHGNLIEYVLEPKPTPTTGKVTEDSPIELIVSARAQWSLSRDCNLPDVKPPLLSTNPLIVTQNIITDHKQKDNSYEVKRYELLTVGKKKKDDQWLSQVEIITHTGPHRRLWMGPQFQFMTCQNPQTTVISASSSALLSQSPESPTSSDITEELDLHSLSLRPARSNPVAMPGHSSTFQEYGGGSSIPVLIEAASGSFEQSPSILHVCSGTNVGSWQDGLSSTGHNIRQSDPILEHQLRENLAEAMLESPSKDQTSANDSSGGGEHSTSSSMCRVSSGEFQASSDELSTASTHSDTTSQAFDARRSPPHSIEHVLVFPTNSPESSS
ncbi:BCAS3 (predicted) [Pycnogonum litorale]